MDLKNNKSRNRKVTCFPVHPNGGENEGFVTLGLSGADLGKNLTRAQVENSNKCSRLNKKIWKLIEKKETIEI